MNLSPALRFVGMLSSERAESVARSCIEALDAQYPALGSWQVLVKAPAAQLSGAAYAVRVQAQLGSGAVVATRTHDADLAAAVHDAFEGLEQLLQQECTLGAAMPWLHVGAGAAPHRLAD